MGVCACQQHAFAWKNSNDDGFGSCPRGQEALGESPQMVHVYCKEKSCQVHSLIIPLDLRYRLPSRLSQTLPASLSLRPFAVAVVEVLSDSTRTVVAAAAADTV